MARVEKRIPRPAATSCTRKKGRNRGSEARTGEEGGGRGGGGQKLEKNVCEEQQGGLRRCPANRWQRPHTPLAPPLSPFYLILPGSNHDDNPRRHPIKRVERVGGLRCRGKWVGDEGGKEKHRRDYRPWIHYQPCPPPLTHIPS